MKQLYLNLKRFDVPTEFDGVNRLAEMKNWATEIIESTQRSIKEYTDPAEFTMYFPEAHLLHAIEAKEKGSKIKIGCQGVHTKDTEPGGNFGAFTGGRPASAMKAMGCDAVIIGHCEERNDKKEILSEAGVTDVSSVNRILNKEVLCAQKRDLDVLYCIGENIEEMEQWQEVLGRQLEEGLKGADTNHVVIGYEPIWSIGPGKKPADREYIQKVTVFIKEKVNGIKVVYGGGLKNENAGMLASIPELDGGLIALTRFQGEIGFYPEEYLEIIKTYMKNI